jgi:hypothetical protein
MEESIRKSGLVGRLGSTEDDEEEASRRMRVCSSFLVDHGMALRSRATGGTFEGWFIQAAPLQHS